MHFLGLLTGVLVAIGLMLVAMFISRRRKSRQAAANVDEVADAAGFSSRTSFFRNFKAVTGMTPQEWRKAD